MKKQTDLKSSKENINDGQFRKFTIPEKTYSQTEIQILYRGLAIGNKSTFQELYKMRSEVHKDIIQLAGDGNPVELDIIKTEIAIAGEFIKNIQDADMIEKIALYRDFLYRMKSKKLSLSDLNYAQIAAYFFYNEIKVTNSNIKPKLLEHGISKLSGKLSKIVTFYNIWNSAKYRAGSTASQLERTYRRNIYENVGPFLKGKAKTDLEADFQIFKSHETKKE